MLKFGCVLVVIFPLIGCGDDSGGGNNQNNQNNSSCGNGVLDQGEECDDGVNNSDTEADACRTNCRTAHCGDEVADSVEECDAQDLKYTICEDLGFTGGVLTCDPDCVFRVTECAGCGNGVIEPGEQCDTPAMGGATCASEFDLQHGTLLCDEDCRFDASGCYTCGNGVREGPEVCDGDSFDGVTCADLGFSGGQLACDADCSQIDDSGCTCTGNSYCLATEFCEKAGCNSATGYCVSRPVDCTEGEMPVCGCDGITYFNDCVRQSAGVVAESQGICGNNATQCGGFAQLPCPGSAVCAYLFAAQTLCGIADPMGMCWGLPVSCPALGGGQWRHCTNSTCLPLCEAILNGGSFYEDGSCP